MEIFSAHKATVWIAKGYADHILVARRQEFAFKVFLSKYQYSPTILMEVEYYIDADSMPRTPNIIKPEVI